MADELTAVFGGILAYVAVLAALGIGVIHLLGLDDISPASGPGPRTAAVAVAQPYQLSAVDTDRAEVPGGPELRRNTAK